MTIENTSEGPTPEVAPETLSDEQLEAAINGADEASEDVEEALTEEGPEDTETAEPESSEEVDYKQKYEAELEKSSKREAHLKHVERFNLRQSNEIGALRKQLSEFIEAKNAGLDEQFALNPRQALKDTEDIKAAEKQLADLDQQEAVRAHVMQSFETVAANIKKEEFDLPGMVEVLRHEGYPEDFLQGFQANPFAFAHGETLVHLAKRTKVERTLAELVPYTRQLYDAYLKLRGKPKDVLRKIQQVSKQTPSVTSANGGVSRNSQPSETDIALKTDEEIADFLRNNLD